MNTIQTFTRPASWQEWQERTQCVGPQLAESVAHGLAYQPQPSDLFISPYAKCGATWVQQIVHGLRTRGDMNFDDIMRVMPWVEMAHWAGLDMNAPQPGGAFHCVLIDREGFDVATRLTAVGVTCFVLKYRLVRCNTDNPATEVSQKWPLDDHVKPMIPLTEGAELCANSCRGVWDQSGPHRHHGFFRGRHSGRLGALQPHGSEQTKLCRADLFAIQVGAPKWRPG